MRALWDTPVLPHRAVVPWPLVYPHSDLDWVASVDHIQSWLDTNVGPHWVDWTWSMWALHNPYHCGVSFRHPKHVSLFLLRFG